jgi:hypothetical protein
MMADFHDTAQRAGKALVAATPVEAEAWSTGGGPSRVDRLLQRPRQEGGLSRVDRLFHRQRPEGGGASRRAHVLP